MKKLITMLFVAVLFIGCATTYYDSNGNPISKETMNQLTAEAVNGHLNEHRYRIFVDRMYPNQGPSRYLNNDYGLEVSGDSVGLSLPYWEDYIVLLWVILILLYTLFNRCKAMMINLLRTVDAS